MFTSWVADLLSSKPTDKGGRAADNRRFVEAVLFIARTGCPWRDLPKDFGNWHSTYVRFARWESGGVWARVAEALQGEADLEELFIDATIVRAHQHSAGALKKTVAIGRSRGGLTTNIHACVDALGNPLRLILTGGQVADVTQGAALVADIPTTAVSADKGYDSGELVETIESSVENSPVILRFSSS